jgi:hypothetical protein
MQWRPLASLAQADSDSLEFYIDDVRQDRISGEVDWELKSYDITSSGTHTLKWRYVKDDYGSDGNDCGWVDHVQWTGAIGDDGPPEPLPTDFEQITYTYDPSGRRIAKALGLIMDNLQLIIGSAWLAVF